jgi:hypothetical protein
MRRDEIWENERLQKLLSQAESFLSSIPALFDSELLPTILLTYALADTMF